MFLICCGVCDENRPGFLILVEPFATIRSLQWRFFSFSGIFGRSSPYCFSSHVFILSPDNRATSASLPAERHTAANPLTPPIRSLPVSWVSRLPPDYESGPSELCSELGSTLREERRNAECITFCSCAVRCRDLPWCASVSLRGCRD